MVLARLKLGRPTCISGGVNSPALTSKRDVRMGHLASSNTRSLDCEDRPRADDRSSLGMTECRNYGSSEDQAVWLAEEVPGFAVVGVGVGAVVSLGSKEQ